MSTVRAIVMAAREAVATTSSACVGSQDASAAVQKLLDRLSSSDRVLLSARVWTPHPRAHQDVARELGVHATSVLRNLPRAEARLAELLADPAHRDVVTHGEQLRDQLGPLARERTVRAALDTLGVDSSSQAGQLLLYLAGPYAVSDAWLENISSAGLSTAAATLDAAFDRWGAPNSATLVRELAQIGMPRDVTLDFLQNRQGLRRFDDKWVRWGSSAAEKAEAVSSRRRARAASPWPARQPTTSCSSAEPCGVTRRPCARPALAASTQLGRAGHPRDE